MPIPQLCPPPRGLDDLDLMSRGALPARFDPPGGQVVLDVGGIGEPDVELVDPEGLPLARLQVAGSDDDATWGSLEMLAPPAYGAFRRLYLTTDQTRERYAGYVTVPVTAPLTEPDLAEIRDAGSPALLLTLVGHGMPQGVSGVGLLRATLAAAHLLDDAAVVAVPLASRGEPALDRALTADVVAAYAPGDVLRVAGVGDLPGEVAVVVEFDRPPADRRGLVVFFTGLSGSGKSTIARALHDELLEAGQRTVTSLDGDVVRRNLSAGLGFSQEDRETNIRRIGWVAAEISRHGGIAICSPIAPFDRTRQQVRAMVADAGGTFFLVHVATPLEECERRDRKGLYAKARRGEIGEFTGISSPYEEPGDADVRIDTTGRSIESCLAEVLDGLTGRGLLTP
ncbi:MAG: adenylyl-sulfate kinase [Nocardioidaceae bacterium]